MPEPRLELRQLTRRFGAFVANDAIDLSVRPGEIHAILGENGAGKSTLVKMIYGVLRPDSGEILWEGRRLKAHDPRAARQLGIGMVFQHFSLFEAMTVAENVALGLDRPGKLGPLAARIREVSLSYGLPLEPEREVHTLSVGERQRIEIVRCLLAAPRLLVMDEPTSVLTPQEADALFATLRLLAAQGCSILYISHKLREIRALCGSATILRGGRVVGACDPLLEDEAGLARRMMGGEVARASRRPAAAARAEAAAVQADAVQADAVQADAVQADAVQADARQANARQADARQAGALQADAVQADARQVGALQAGAMQEGAPARLVLDGVSLPARSVGEVGLHGVCLALRAGEIVGVAGIAGNGQSELFAAVSGERLAGEAAAVRLDGRPCGRLGPAGRRAAGLCSLPEDRQGHGAVPEFSLGENALLTAHARARLVRRGVVHPGAAERFAERVIAGFDVRGGGAAAPAATLSGGNLQKFLVGREIAQAPGVLVVAQPSWGVDAGAAALIHSALLALAESGAAVLVISQDLDELLLLSDRLAVLHLGRLSAPRACAAWSVAEIGLAMGGAGQEAVRHAA